MFNNNYCYNSLVKLLKLYNYIDKLYIINYSIFHTLYLDRISSLYIFSNVVHCADICLPNYSYVNLKAISLYNHFFDPDEYYLPNLEYLFVYNERCELLNTIIMFDVTKFPKLIYLNLTGLLINPISKPMNHLEFININRSDILSEHPAKYLPSIKFIEIFDLSTINVIEYYTQFKNIKYIISEFNEYLTDLTVKYYFRRYF